VKASILIVDDEFGLAELLVDILAERGYETTVAINGRQGLACLREKSIDLAIVDLMMPIMNGMELVAAMRGTTELADIPVVAMTTVPRELGPVHDVQAVLRKPFTSDDLLRTIAEVLDAARTRPEER
jgi:two-component system OmpR family response regulator